MNEDALEQAKRTWNEIDINQVRDVSWCSISFISKKIARSFSGTESPVSLIHNLLAQRLTEEHSKKLRGAALVCGDMEAERGFFENSQTVKFAEVHGYDLSEVSLAKYVSQEEVDFTPSVIDCNDLILERNTYDLIVGCHGVHHVYNLGNIFYQAHKSLKDGGLIYLYEWIGLEYLQIPRTNHIVASILLVILFPSRSMRRTHMGKVKGRWVQYRQESFDPSEACNSQELQTQFLKYFRPLRVDLHGGLAYPIFEGIAQNIDQSELSNKIKIRLVYYIERILTKMKIVKPCFMVVLAEKRAI